MAEKSERMQKLRDREEGAKDRLSESARSLADMVSQEAKRLQEEHPWALPAIGFCAGLLVPFLVPARREAAARTASRATSHVRDAWDEARCAAADTLTEAVGAVIRRLLAPEPRERWTEDGNGCSR
jgi:hypothetical protein